MGALRVAVGVVSDPDGRVLIAQRAAHRHQGGLWEFPGGKIEAGETAFAALVRELHEEVGIRVIAADYWLSVPFEYPDLSVTLDVYRVLRFRGDAAGREGQPLVWVSPPELGSYAFPAANRPILAALLATTSGACDAPADPNDPA